jgi:mono/diheme cytochrome c family protein
MSLLSGTTVLGAVLTFAVSASAQDQDRDMGKIEYQSNCASCHGIDAKGDGPVSGELKKRPPDLTVLAKKNGGVFPLNFVYRIIDGRDEIASHGSREMPVWGYRSSRQNTSS